MSVINLQTYETDFLEVIKEHQLYPKHNHKLTPNQNTAFILRVTPCAKGKLGEFDYIAGLLFNNETQNYGVPRKTAIRIYFESLRILVDASKSHQPLEAFRAISNNTTPLL